MSEEEVERTEGQPAAPEGVGERDTPGGTDIASAAKIGAPRAHPSPETAPEPAELPDEGPSPERAIPDDEVIAALVEPFDDVTWEQSHGQDVLRVPRERLAELARAAREAGFEVCADVTAVDWFRRRRVRFEVVVSLLSHSLTKRLRLLVPVPADDPTVPSVVPMWPGANFGEREAYDMFGIVFEGHPDLTRILMPDDWEGYPLRKDHAVGAVPVQFKQAHRV